jgi:N-acetyl-gamma-glutamyl-phosphate reductase
MLDIFVFGSSDHSQSVVIARLDNLGKGASGAAVQNLNLMLGLPEGLAVNLPV